MAEPLETVEQIIEFNRSKGFHFFDDSNVASYKSRVMKKVYLSNSKTYFVESEKYLETNERVYIVCCIDWETGIVSYVEEFEPFPNQREALSAAKSIAEGKHKTSAITLNINSWPIWTYNNPREITNTEVRFNPPNLYNINITGDLNIASTAISNTEWVRLYNSITLNTNNSLE